MQKLAQETREAIASYVSTKPDLSSLCMTNHAFANACRRVRYATIHLSEAPPFPPLFCAGDIKGYSHRCLGTVVAVSRAIRCDFPEVGKNIRRIVFFTEYLKTIDVDALIQLIETAPSVMEFVFVGTDLGFFMGSLRLLLSSMKMLLTLRFKGCSISTQTLNAIVQASLRLTTCDFGCTNDYNITMDDVTVDTHIALVQGDLALGLLQRSLRTLPLPSLEFIQLRILNMPKSWCPGQWVGKSPDYLSMLDSILCDIVHPRSFRGMVVCVTFYTVVTESFREKREAHTCSNPSLLILPVIFLGDNTLMDKLSQEIIDHIVHFLTSKPDLDNCSLVHRCFLSECCRIKFRTISVNETIPCPTGYVWILETTRWTAKEAADNLQRYYPDIHRYVRVVRFCGGSVKKEDVAGLMELFVQLPLATSFILEGFSGDSVTLPQLSEPLRKIESLTFSRGIVFADDLNNLLPVDVTADDISPETHVTLACLRSLDLSMPEVEDDSVQENYEWLHSIWLPTISELRIHSYCEWWCERANFLMDGLGPDSVHCHRRQRSQNAVAFLTQHSEAYTTQYQLKPHTLSMSLEPGIPS
ncbi:uncharacterized protein EV420DRAFT_1488929 [Desarmillaria tabescens]|uniref:Uncharacterized protein n=1 Tax=Armillaria tabescens TaxID=1929756 RepID=A0AA39MHF3_ARMTA|nr:uncharacterized protein EV420DRAFT_1488929 [Desarmillaria tabescens]KAK0433834.1 hypothetical protein EV420DRAFT_1488929 [Desarmillaria tabescens]